MTPDPAGDLTARMVRPAGQLAWLVHGGGGQKDVTDLLESYATRELEALCVVLAAMVDPDKTTNELLAWTEQAPTEAPARPLEPHGTHAAFNRHRSNGTQPCPTCREGERTYQRLRARRARAQVKEAA